MQLTRSELIDQSIAFFQIIRSSFFRLVDPIKKIGREEKSGHNRLQSHRYERHRVSQGSPHHFDDIFRLMGVHKRTQALLKAAGREIIPGEC